MVQDKINDKWYDFYIDKITFEMWLDLHIECTWATSTMNLKNKRYAVILCLQCKRCFILE